ncbi:MAG: hypothetical protein JO307_14015 [Bryobacterales bacterium]|nr:hypothetical protein [Bryobacterales bacterium]MBV9398617.1 hypothetical protein [Bryobacterales bacterium]
MKLLTAAALCSAALCAGADIEHSATLDEGYAQMYNLRFEDAHRTFQQWERAHPADPMGPASDAAAYLFSEFDRLHVLQSELFAQDQQFLRMHKLSPDPAAKSEFEKDLNAAEQLAAADASTSTDSLFAQVLQHGLHSDYLAMIEKRYVAALGETKQARAAAEKVLSSNPDFYDANLAIGIENYMLSLKPAPIRLLLRATGSETDKQAGIEKLRLTAEKGHYLAPFARLLLAVAALRDKDRNAAREQLSWLAAHYPENRLFRAELAKVQ